MEIWFTRAWHMALLLPNVEETPVLPIALLLFQHMHLNRRRTLYINIYKHDMFFKSSAGGVRFVIPKIILKNCKTKIVHHDFHETLIVLTLIDPVCSNFLIVI